MTTALLWKHKY